MKWNAWREENKDVEIDLREIELENVNLSSANLHMADLSEAILKQSNLHGVDLSGAELFKSSLIETTLTNANLAAAFLTYADLSDSDLSYANLRGADLRGVIFVRSELRGANLSGANLSRAFLQQAYLEESYFSRSNVWKANFNSAMASETQFVNVDLSVVYELDQMSHHRPSTIGLDTIRKSKGKLPLEFLRGCGLTDFEIVTAQLQNPDLTRDEFLDLTYKLDELRNAGSIVYHSCLISYSAKNQEIAKRLHNDLQESGVRCWYAPHDMKIGEEIRPALNRAVSMNEKLLLILSKDALESQWVEYEVEAALKKERSEKTPMLFPIRIDDVVMETNEGWADYIRNTRHIGDFREWHDEASYKRAFDRLKKDLQQNVT